MDYDFRKKQSVLYCPIEDPIIINVPTMNYLAVEGLGSQDRLSTEFKQAIDLLLPVAYILQKSGNYNHDIPGSFPYVLPPLEGLWWEQFGRLSFDNYSHDNYKFLALSRLPDFITRDDYEWAVKFARKRKSRDFSDVKFITLNEGKCVQMLHRGPCEEEKTTLDTLKEYVDGCNYDFDIGSERKHHEIYLKDLRRIRNRKNLRTGIRIPIKKSIKL